MTMPQTVPIFLGLMPRPRGGGGRAARTGDDASDGGVGGGDVGVGAEVDVEHDGVAALHEDLLVAGEGVVEEGDGVGDHGEEDGEVALDLLELLLGVVLELAVAGLELGLEVRAGDIRRRGARGSWPRRGPSS